MKSKLTLKIEFQEEFTNIENLHPDDFNNFVCKQIQDALNEKRLLITSLEKQQTSKLSLFVEIFSFSSKQ